MLPDKMNKEFKIQFELFKLKDSSVVKSAMTQTTLYLVSGVYVAAGGISQRNITSGPAD